MGWIDRILKRFDARDCYFYQSSACVLGKRACIACNLKCKKIVGVDTVKDHLGFVLTKNIANRNYIVAILALILSLITLTIKLVELSAAQVSGPPA